MSTIGENHRMLSHLSLRVVANLTSP